MSPKLSTIFAGICLLILGGVFPSNAEAGYLRVTETSGTSLTSNWGPAATGTPKTKQIEAERLEFGIVGRSSGASAPSNSPSSTSSGNVAVLLSSDFGPQVQLVQWRVRTDVVRVPSPVSSGIFRPPRCV